MKLGSAGLRALTLAACFLWGATCAAQPLIHALPGIGNHNGRPVLVVDGKPYLVLGAQANNSSNYATMLPKVWPVVKRMNANTLEIPVAWEQIEPVEGQFDFSFIDALLREARANDVRVVLLWFATWKNTSPSYAPEWVKTDTRRFPRMKKPDGTNHYVLSPHGRATLEADKKAFTRLMRHIGENDPQSTIIMIQPQNEIGSYGLARDHAPEADRLFRGQVPTKLVRRLGKSRGTWSEVFGEFAEQAFTSWHMASYVEEIVSAGKDVLNLPMFCNAALGDAFDAKAASTSPSGGPQWNMIDVWKAAAPNLDFVAPDIYSRDHKAVMAYLGYYGRPDNALMIPEIGNAGEYARFIWPALGQGAIGIAPFGMDETGYSNYPLGAKDPLAPEELEAWASIYRLFKPVASTWAHIAITKPTWGTAKGSDGSDQTGVLGRWKLTAQYELWEFGEREWTWIKRDDHPTKGKPVGGMVAALLSPNEILLSGSHVRVRLGLAEPAPGESGTILRVEEGTFDEAGTWRMTRVWNGDQTDYGLNFTAQPVFLKVKMGVQR